MMSEFAHCYGHRPDGMAWHLFLTMLHDARRFEARTQLTLFDAVRSAIGAALAGPEAAGEVESAHEALFRLAYPSGESSPSKFVENTLRKDGDG